jgi:hypothetical protein
VVTQRAGIYLMVENTFRLYMFIESSLLYKLWFVAARTGVRDAELV